MNTNTSPQPREQGAVPPMPLTPSEQSKHKAAEYTRQQMLQALQNPEIKVSAADRIRAQRIFRTPLDQRSEEDNKLLAKVAENFRILNLLSAEERTKIAEEDIKFLERARKQGWLEEVEKVEKVQKARGRKIA